MAAGHPDASSTHHRTTGVYQPLLRRASTELAHGRYGESTRRRTAGHLAVPGASVAPLSPTALKAFARPSRSACETQVAICEGAVVSAAVALCGIGWVERRGC